MLDDFLVRAALAGIGVAAVAGPLGCFIVWRRLAYFGDTMAHSALLGVALAVLLEIDLMIGVFGIALLVALSLAVLGRAGPLSSDSLLGLLSHSTLALGLVIISMLSWLRVDLMAFLFGDILAVAHVDLIVIWIGVLVVLAVLVWIWRPLLAMTVHEEVAAAEGLKPWRARLVFLVLMAAVIAVAMKIVGALLITALLIIPAATSRLIARSPETMAVGAAFLGAIAVVGGLGLSLEIDSPSGPSIVVAALVLFLGALAVRLMIGRR
jgi:zinc transport system permease protein